MHARARRLPSDRYDRVKKEFEMMQELGICRPSKSACASPLHVVPKKGGDIRPCGDYRMLNVITKPDRYLIPRIQDFTYGLHNKVILSKIDIYRAYHFIKINPEDIEKTAIITPFGLYEFPRMIFGLRNAAQSFQRFINNTVLADIEQLNCDKFDKFLGYEVFTEGIRPLEDKVKAIEKYPKPETIEQLHRFLGMINFYRNHIPNAARVEGVLDSYLQGSKKND